MTEEEQMTGGFAGKNLWVLVVVWACWLCSGPALAGPKEAGSHVIPAGAEKLFLQMTSPGKDGFPGGWSLEGVSIKVVSAVVTYRAPDDRQTAIELVHPSMAESPLTTTERFALVQTHAQHPPPKKLIAALSRQIARFEKGFKWVLQVRSNAVPIDRLNRVRYAVPDPVRTEWNRSLELVSKGQSEEAARLAGGWTIRYPDSLPVARATASILRRVGDGGKAAGVLRKALGKPAVSNSPSSRPVYLELAASLALSEPNEADDIIGKVAADFSRLYPDVSCARMECLQVLLNEGLAAESLRLALGKGAPPTRCEHLFLLKAASHRGVDEEVDGRAESALKAYPDDQDTLFLWGTYYYKKGAGQKTLLKAARIWDRLARINPLYPTFIGQYGTVYLVGKLLGREATRFLKKKAEKDVDDVVAAYLAGIGLYYQRRYHEVIPFLARAANAVPDDPRASMYLAMAHFFDGDRKKAARMLEALDHHAYQEPDIYYCRSLFYRSHDLPRAIREMEQFIEVFEGENRLRFGQEKVEKARDDLRRMKKGEVPDVHLPIPDPLPPGQPYPERLIPEKKRGSHEQERTTGK